MQSIRWAVFGSVLLLGGAFAFQYIGALAPCKMCIWQRWPHAIAIAVGLLVVATKERWLIPLGGLAIAVGAGIAFYHVGVEQGWLEGPQGCTGGPITGMSAEALLAQIEATPVVRCDQIAWSLGGISMAGWNGIASLVLLWLWWVGWDETR